MTRSENAERVKLFRYFGRKCLNNFIKGNFLGSASKKDGSPFISRYTLEKQIDILTSGTHELNFYTFFNCPVSCVDSGDSITIKINNFNSNPVFRKIAEISRDSDLGWVNETIKFNLLEGKLRV